MNRIPEDGGATPRSYRDPMSRVEVSEDAVTRYLGVAATEWFRAVEQTGLLRDLVAGGLLHPFETRELSEGSMVVTSRRIPFVTVPSEWTAGMLRDAALLTLDIVARAWDHGVHVRDASAFNVVFDGGKPVFVDHGSFRYGLTPFWHAYGQFCDHFLNPLALSSLTNTPVSLGWSSSLEGLSARELRGLLGLRSARRGLFQHVYLRAALDRGGDRLDRGTRTELRSEFGVRPDRTRRLLTKLTRDIRRLEVAVPTDWVGYESDNTYSVAEAAAKAQAMRRLVSVAGGSGGVAVDLGANTGNYSAALARHFRHVVALDSAEGAVERLYQRLGSGDVPANITVGVADLIDPTPGRGFLNEERPSLFDRLAGADLFVWLALIHHLVISRNVPLGLVVTMARRLGRTHIIEHVGPEDPMSRLLAASRPEAAWPLDRVAFEQAVGREFVIVEMEEVTPHRSLYLLEALDPPSSDLSR